MADGTGILFDVDGTLLDTNYLHTVAWSRAFRQLGHDDITMSRIHHLIGMGGDKLTESLLGHPDDGVADAWKEQYEILIPEIRALPGARDLLREVAGRGATVVLATSSPGEHVEAQRRALDADDAVDEVTSSGDADESKPAPDIFAVALEKGGLAPERTLAVGDSVWDVEAAGRSGLDCVCLATGGISPAELAEAGAAGVYEDPADLLAHLDESPLARLLDT